MKTNTGKLGLTLVIMLTLLDPSVPCTKANVSEPNPSELNPSNQKIQQINQVDMEQPYLLAAVPSGGWYPQCFSIVGISGTCFGDGAVKQANETFGRNSKQRDRNEITSAHCNHNWKHGSDLGMEVILRMKRTRREFIIKTPS